MLTALVFALRKAFRLGIPIGSCAAAIGLYGYYTGWEFLSYMAVAILCVFVAVFGISISSIWDDNNSVQQRRQIKINIEKVQDHIKEKRIARRKQLSSGIAKAGNDDPTIYEYTSKNKEPIKTER